jgi:hypothetical protein
MPMWRTRVTVDLTGLALPADGEDRAGGSPEDSLCRAPHEEAAESRAAMGAHHDQVCAVPARRAEDLLGGFPFDDPGLDRYPGLLRLGDESGQLPLDLAPRSHLQIDEARGQLVPEERRRRHEDVKQDEVRPLLFRQLERPGEAGT